MNRRALGRTGLAVTELGFGGAPLGGMFAAVEAAEASAALAAAWDAGVRYFDTAPLYGFGLSEQRLGAFLRTKPRGEFVLSTKVGRVLRPVRPGLKTDGSLAPFFGALPNEAVFDFSAAGVERCIAGSLERLGLERIDLLYLHDPEEHVEAAIREAYPVLRGLRASGAIGAIGIGTNYVDVAQEFVRRCELDVCMAAGRYTVLDRSAAAGLLPLCAERNVAFVAGGVFNSGILSRARPADETTFDYAPASPAVVAAAKQMAATCERYGTELPAAALRFPLDNAAVACALVGMRSAREVRANVVRLAATAPPQLFAALEAEALETRARPR